MLQLSEFDIQEIARIYKDRTGFVNFLGGITQNLNDLLPVINEVLQKKQEDVLINE